jgi:hypothetical protein
MISVPRLLGVTGAEVMEGENVDVEEMVDDNEETVDGVDGLVDEGWEGDLISACGNRIGAPSL